MRPRIVGKNFVTIQHFLKFVLKSKTLIPTQQVSFSEFSRFVLRTALTYPNLTQPKQSPNCTRTQIIRCPAALRFAAEGQLVARPLGEALLGEALLGEVLLGEARPAASLVRSIGSRSTTQRGANDQERRESSPAVTALTSRPGGGRAWRAGARGTGWRGGCGH